MYSKYSFYECNIIISRILCIDSTHNTTHYDFKLVTILVKDNTDTGVPVAHLVTNHENEKVLTVFFREVLKKSGTLVLDYIITYIYLHIYSSILTY